MDEKKKKALILISIGVLLPLVFLFFTSGYIAEAGFIKNLLNLKIMINLFGKTIGIPYRFIVAAGVIIVYAGITIIIKKEE